MGLWLFPIAVALFFAADHYNFRDVYDRTLLSAASGEDVSIHLWAFGAFVVMYALRFFETNITSHRGRGQGFLGASSPRGDWRDRGTDCENAPKSEPPEPQVCVSSRRVLRLSRANPDARATSTCGREQPSWTSRGLLRRTTARSRSGRSSPRASSLRSRTSTAFGQRSLETC